MIHDSAIVAAIDSLEAYNEEYLTGYQDAIWYGPESLWYPPSCRRVYDPAAVRALSIRMIQTWRDYGYIELLKLAHVDGSWRSYPKGPNHITDTKRAHFEALTALCRAGLLNQVNTDVRFPKMNGGYLRIEQHYPYEVPESYPSGSIFGGNGLIVPHMNRSMSFFENLTLAGYTLVFDGEFSLWCCFIPGFLPCWTTRDLAQSACLYWQSYKARYAEGDFKIFGSAMYCEAFY